MWELLQQLGRVPRRLIWDNESGIRRGKRHAEGVAAFAGVLATTVQRLKPYDPESKGIVERRTGLYEFKRGGPWPLVHAVVFGSRV